MDFTPPMAHLFFGTDLSVSWQSHLKCRFCVLITIKKRTRGKITTKKAYYPKLHLFRNYLWKISNSWAIVNIFYHADKNVLLLDMLITHKSFHLGFSVSKKSGHLLTCLDTGAVCASKCHKRELTSLRRNAIACHLRQWMERYYVKPDFRQSISYLQAQKDIHDFPAFTQNVPTKVILSPHASAVIYTAVFCRLVLPKIKQNL